MKEVLNRELKSRNESLQKLAKATNVPRATLHGWSQGMLPSAKNIHHLKSLADYFDISISMLLFNVNDEKSRDSILFSSTFVDQDKRYRLTIEKLSK